MWSIARARQVAAEVRAAEFGPEAAVTLRQRSVTGLTRDRAPLPVLLWIAARDGLVVEQDGGGYAVLQRPLGVQPGHAGGYLVRAVRRLDRHWSYVIFAGPPLAGLLAAITAGLLGVRGLGIALVLAALLWVCLYLTSLVVAQVRHVARMGGAPRAARDPAADSLALTHWSVRLVHQPDPDKLELLLQKVSERLSTLMQADLQAAVGHRALVGVPAVTETVVVLTRGVTTAPARAAVERSLRAVPNYTDGRDVVLLAPLTIPDRVPPRPLAGGGFFVLYAVGVAVAVAVGALIVASTERAACAPGSCAGRPATYSAAVRYLLQRLLFTDPPGLTPATTRVVVLGWLVSLASVMFVVVAVEAGRQEIMRTRRDNSRYDTAMEGVTKGARVLILVVTEGERDAVLDSAQARTGQPPVIDQAGRRTLYRLGRVEGTEVLLMQAVEQGIQTAAGMMMTAKYGIEQNHPDYVILTGICYGLRPDEGQRPGHVIVARRVHNIDPRKITDNAERPVIRRGVHVGCSTLLLDRFQAAQRTWKASDVHVGLMLTSSAVVNSKDEVDRLRVEFEDALGGEMEAAGVYEAASEEDKPDWIMVKAICDWGYGKNDDCQPLAARNAANFVMHVISNSRLPRRPRHRLSVGTGWRSRYIPVRGLAAVG
jgi:nucleoside phosphorylase